MPYAPPRAQGRRMSNPRLHPDALAVHFRDDPGTLRAVVALGLFSLAEHAVWVTVLVVAYQQGGVREAGGVSAALLAPAALMAPVAAREMADPAVRHPLATGYLLQTATLALATGVLALDLDPVLFYMAGVLVTITTVFSRPAHHAFIALSGPTVAATVATGAVSGAAQLAGPLLAAVVLARYEVVHVFVIATALLSAASAITIRLPPRPALIAGCALPPPVNRATTTTVIRGRSAADRRCILLLFGLLGLVGVVLGTIETLATEVSFSANHTGGSGAGVLLASTGAGLLVGAPLAGAIARRATEGTAMRIGAFIAGGAVVLAGVDGGVALSLAAFGCVGVGMQTVLVSGWLLLHRHVCNANTGAVFGVIESQHLVGNALGALGSGAAMSRVGVWPVLVVVGVGLAGSMLTLSPDRIRRLSSTTTVVSGGVRAPVAAAPVAATSTEARTA